MLDPDVSIKLSVSKNIVIDLGCTIIPILLTQLETENIALFNHLSKYITIPNTYKQLIEQIEYKIKHDNLNMASITIENHTGVNKTHKSHVKSNSKKTIKNQQTIKKQQTIKNHQSSKNLIQKIHQIFIIAINNKSYDNIHNEELLEISRVSGNAIFGTLRSNQIKYINIVDAVDPSKISKSNSIKKADAIISGSTQFIEAMLEGLMLSSYKFLKYKTSHSLSKDKDNFNLSRINIVLPHYSKHIHHDEIHYRFRTLQNQVKTVFLARDLINEPANTSKSTTFLSIINAFITKHKLPISVEVLNKAKLEKLGMGLILGVGSGSSIENEPKVVIMKYKGRTKTLLSPEYILLGKGITFDTGGLDVKGARSMIEMKTDLSGAATVMSFLLGYAMNKGKKCIYTLCPFAENSVGPNSTKPSDVLKAYNGRTVEIANTDAEGRLVLADCLAYAVDKYPKAILIDFATLTGQQESMSGKMFSTILSVNSKHEVDKLIESGKTMNEMLVEMPIMEKQLKNLESYTADIKNVSFTSSADIIMSSLFMRQFLKKHSKWIHIDIAGPSYKAENVIKYASPEASGVGVRLLFDYFK